MDDAPFYYSMEVSADYVKSLQTDLFPEDAYEVEGVFQLPKREPARRRLVFNKVAAPPLPTISRTELGEGTILGRGKKGRGRILVRQNVYDQLMEMELSDKVENGGYLLGLPFRTPRSPKNEDDPKFKWTVEITDLLAAQGAHGTPGLLLFNGDVWSQMRRTASRDLPDKKLVSWFHTHLFAASDDFGLSGLDQELHRQFFSRPWQVAVLVNIDSQGGREVRCFQRGAKGDLEECKFELLK